MKIKLIASGLILVFMGGCKEIAIPDNLQIGNFSADDIRKGLSIAGQVYDAAKDISPEQEYYIGRSVAANILSKYKLYNNKNINDYLNKIGRLIIINSQEPEIFAGYHFSVLDSDEINAFATPGGFVFVTRGMLRMCKNEDELAAVLAHEVSHIQLKHGLKSIKDSRWTSVATTLSMEAAKSYTEKKYNSKELSDLTKSFTNSLDDIVNTLVVNGYSREYEEEADKYALNILQQSGYADSAMLGMLQKMEKVLQNDGRGFGSTHPKPMERKEAIQNIVTSSDSDIYANRTKRFKYLMKNV